MTSPSGWCAGPPGAAHTAAEHEACAARLADGRLEGCSCPLHQDVACTCPYVDPKYWTTYYGAVEPGSMQEYDPTCPAHGETKEAS
jgi:hypothetical protein